MSKPKKPQKKTPDKQQKRDFFQTPKYAVDLLVPYIPKQISRIWECASGQGKIVHRLHWHGYKLFETELIRGFNFLDQAPQFAFDAIVTNPPFSLKEEFYKKCRGYGTPFALLVPMDMTQWNLEAVMMDGAQWLVPTRRIDYITPNGHAGKNSAAQFHSGWLTWGFGLPNRLTINVLTLETKKNPDLI